jgi:hypothetical protein
MPRDFARQRAVKTFEIVASLGRSPGKRIAGADEI